MLDLNDNAHVIDSLAHQFTKQKVLFFQTDVSDLENVRRSFENAFKQFGKIDIVIGNAGMSNELQQQRVIQVNLVRVE